MPNPQVHVAVGMLGTLILYAAFYPVCKNFYRKYRLHLFLPIFILIGGALSTVPDIPELARYFPSVSEPLGIDYHDKPQWNTKAFNIFFAHPYLDANYEEAYDTVGILLALLAFNIISLYYLYLSEKPSKY